MSRDESLRDLIRRASERVSTRAARASTCLDPDRLLELYQGRLAEAHAEEVRTHLSVCPSCLALSRDVRVFTDAGCRREERSKRRLFSRPGMLRAAALVALGVVIGAGLTMRRESGTGIAIEELLPRLLSKREWAPPVPVSELKWRDADPPRSDLPDDPFTEAMEFYSRDEFTEASRRLELVLDANPFHEQAALYLGISLLLSGQPAAGEVLERLSDDRAAAAVVRSEASWYLALALLGDGRTADALEALELAAALGEGPRRQSVLLLRGILRRAEGDVRR